MTSRETVYQALFALVSPLQGSTFTTVSRITEHFTGVPSANQPALFQLEIGESGEQLSGTPEKRFLEVLWLVYAYRGDGNQQAAAPILNPLLDALDTALKPAPGFDRQTLGGLVPYARHNGHTEITEGPLGPQIIAAYPVQILMPVDYLP